MSTKENLEKFQRNLQSLIAKATLIDELDIGSVLGVMKETIDQVETCAERSIED